MHSFAACECLTQRFAKRRVCRNGVSKSLLTYSHGNQEKLDDAWTELAACESLVQVGTDAVCRAYDPTSYAPSLLFQVL